MVAAFVASFAIAPALKMKRADVDALYNQQVQPHLRQAANQLTQYQQLLQSRWNTQGNAVRMAATAGVVVVIYFLWQYVMTISTMCTRTFLLSPYRSEEVSAQSTT